MCNCTVSRFLTIIDDALKRTVESDAGKRSCQIRASKRLFSIVWLCFNSFCEKAEF